MFFISNMENYSYVLFHSFGSSGISKPLGKGIMVYLELGDFLILISCHGDKVALFEDVGSEGGVGELEDVAGSHQVEPRLILVHRVQDGLEMKIRSLLRSF